ncbi:hypothetical protein KY290_022232 [Solanum tuberosum]|uniref:Uncharacterized protein n=1 Tax=Solanum tuberosum TaxID=4113 RepID=A0ABQ7V5D2_SOLTU|nr:hypothetical protein KY289_021361 [Solanum tuberosum]KAH0758739.1 hypothetical protein KY290_022232 [Solanum tuberosum]
MNEVGCTSEYLASHSRLLTHSLEKRVIPRYRVLKILNEKHLKRGVGLFTAVSMTPSKFMEAILLPYKDKIPIAYEAYMKRAMSLFDLMLYCHYLKVQFEMKKFSLLKPLLRLEKNHQGPMTHSMNQVGKFHPGSEDPCVAFEKA